MATACAAARDLSPVQTLALLMMRSAAGLDWAGEIWRLQITKNTVAPILFFFMEWELSR